MVSDASQAPAKSPVTLREVASAAGVSVATASKALNGLGRMTAETRERIRETAQRLGFRPNSLAQSLLRQAQLHRRAAHQRYLWPLLAAADVRHFGRAGRRRRLGVSVQCRGRSAPRPASCRGHAGQARRRHHRHRQAHRPPSAGRSLRSAHSRDLRLHRARSRRYRFRLRRCRRRAAGGRAFLPARPPTHRPCHRSGELCRGA